MAEQAPDKSDLHEKQSETSVTERDTSDIKVDLVEDDTVEINLNILAEKEVGKILENIAKVEGLEDEIAEEIETLSLDEAVPDENKNNEGTVEEVIVPIEDPYEKATRYLAKHNIIGLFQVITFTLNLVTKDACS